MKTKNTTKKMNLASSVYAKKWVTMQPKTSVVRLRVTQEQHDALMQAAHDSNLTFSDYARKALLKGIKTLENTYFAG
jgi:hypothetical protein